MIMTVSPFLRLIKCELVGFGGSGLELWRIMTPLDAFRVSIFSIEWRAKELEKDGNSEVKWKPAKVAIYSSIKYQVSFFRWDYCTILVYTINSYLWLAMVGVKNSHVVANLHSFLLRRWDVNRKMMLDYATLELVLFLQKFSGVFTRFWWVQPIECQPVVDPCFLRFEDQQVKHSDTVISDEYIR